MEQKGIDVSKHNGAIDWKKVASEGVKFAIIRAGYGKYEEQKDACFEANITGALENGIAVGAYWFCYALDAGDALLEAQVCDKILAPYRDKLTYPSFTTLNTTLKPTHRRRASAIRGRAGPRWFGPFARK